LSTGARHGELISLRWKQVDLNRRTIELEDTKNGECRTLHLIQTVIDELEQLGRIRDLRTTLVFPSEQDPTKPMTSRTAFENAMAKTGITDFGFHGLRHSAASYMAMHGATQKDIASVLGHKSLQTTERYMHLADEHMGCFCQLPSTSRRNVLR
jgi:integrase